MISIIIFIVGVLFTFGLNILVMSGSYSIIKTTWILLAAIAAQLLINAIVAILGSKVFPDKWFNSENKFYNPSKKECHFYEKLGIKKWKDKNLELGMLNGFRKNKLSAPNNPEYINKFILESNKGFIDHLLGIILGTLLVFGLPLNLILPMGLPIALTNFLINFLSLAILRYNIPRLKTVLRFAERKKQKINTKTY